MSRNLLQKSALSTAVLLTLGVISPALWAQAKPLIINGVTCAGSWSILDVPTSTTVVVPASCLAVAPVGTPTAPPITGTTIYWTVPNPAYNGSSVIIWNAGAGATLATLDCDQNYFQGTGVVHSEVLAGTGSPPGIILPITCTIVASNTTGSASVTKTATVTPQSQAVAGFPTPGIASISPNPPVTGAAFTLTGANFSTTATTVTINGVNVTPYASSTGSLSGTMPSQLAAGPAVLTVTSNGKVSNAFSFTLSAPTAVVGSTACPGSSDCTVEGDIIPTPSRSNPGGSTPARINKLNGSSSFYAPMNMYASADVATKCANATPAITRLWQHNIDFGSYQRSGANDYPYLAPNEAMTYKFTAPAEGSSNIFQYNEGTQVTFVSGFMSISDKPCDFDVNKLVTGPTRNVCYSSEAYGVSIYYKATTGAVQSYECKMIPGQTYYLNLRMQDARPISRGGAPTVDSCAANGYGLCGGYIQIR